MVKRASDVVLGPFRIDQTKQRLWRCGRKVELRPRPVAVLRYLTTRPGEVVTKKDILKTVWAGTCVSETTVKVCAREIRQALEDDLVAPRFIETVGRQGYRFIGEAGGAQLFVVSPQPSARLCVQPGASDESLTTPIVGRIAELAQLRALFVDSLKGQRQFVFVTGETGAGKTTLVDLFLARAREQDSPWIGRGQCIEHYGDCSESFVSLSPCPPTCGAGHNTHRHKPYSL